MEEIDEIISVEMINSSFDMNDLKEFESYQKLRELMSLGVKDWKAISECSYDILKNGFPCVLSMFSLLVASVHTKDRLTFLKYAKAIPSVIEMRWDVILPVRDRARVNLCNMLSNKVFLDKLDLLMFFEEDLESLTNIVEKLSKLNQFVTENLSASSSIILVIKSLRNKKNKLEQSINLDLSQKETKSLEQDISHVVLTDEKFKTADFENKRCQNFSNLTNNDKFQSKILLETSSTSIKSIRLDLQKYALNKLKNIHEDTKDNPSYDCSYSVVLRLMFISKWHGLKLPLDENKIIAKAPLKTRIAFFKNLFKTKQWQYIVEKGEMAFSDIPFWLDLQFYLYQAYDKLEKFDYALIIENELRSFIVLNPEIVDAQFSDGLPLACDETKHWINSLIQNTDSKTFKSLHNNLNNNKFSKSKNNALISNDIIELSKGNNFNQAITLILQSISIMLLKNNSTTGE